MFDFVFVVLVYRNTKDLEDFFCSFHVPKSHVIVVNSYFDDESETEFKRIASKNNADFLSAPNRGYGAGNNRGCEYALTKYNFKYLIVSNADVNVEEMDIAVLQKYPQGIYAPSIRTLKKKQQNPHMPFYISIFDKIKYRLFLKNNWHLIMVFCAINKAFRIFFLYLMKYVNNGKIYSAHGSFVIIPKCVLLQLYPLYDENVFLFTEEEHLAMKARAHGIDTFYVPGVRILHKEDGSTSAISERIREITRESFISFYRKWYQL